MSTNNISTKPLLKFLSQVLKKRFPNDYWKQTPRDRGDKIEIYCPFCGDTNKQHKKPRGHIRLDGKRYNCYNDGCTSRYLKLTDFVIKLSSKFYVPIDGIDLESLKQNESDAKNYKRKKNSAKSYLPNNSNNPIREYLSDVGVLDAMPYIHQFKVLMNIRSLSECLDDINEGKTDIKPIIEYLLNERLIGSCDVAVNNLIYINSDYSKIYLLNCDIKSGKIFSFATRDFEEKVYKIFTFEDMKRIFYYDESVLEGHYDIINDVCSMFNILNVDFSCKAKVTEGQFDSFFLYNSFGLNSVNNDRFINFYFDENDIVSYFDNDKAGTRTTMKMLTNQFFMWSKFKGDLLNRRSNSDMYAKIQEIKDVNDAYKFIVENFKKDLTMIEFNDMCDKYESKEAVDLFYI